MCNSWPCCSSPFCDVPLPRPSFCEPLEHAPLLKWSCAEQPEIRFLAVTERQPMLDYYISGWGYMLSDVVFFLFMVSRWGQTFCVLNSLELKQLFTAHVAWSTTVPFQGTTHELLGWNWLNLCSLLSGLLEPCYTHQSPGFALYTFIHRLTSSTTYRTYPICTSWSMCRQTPATPPTHPAPQPTQPPSPKPTARKAAPEKPPPLRRALVRTTAPDFENRIQRQTPAWTSSRPEPTPFWTSPPRHHDHPNRQFHLRYPLHSPLTHLHLSLATHVLKTHRQRLHRHVLTDVLPSHSPRPSLRSRPRHSRRRSRTRSRTPSHRRPRRLPTTSASTTLYASPSQRPPHSIPTSSPTPIVSNVPASFRQITQSLAKPPWHMPKKPQVQRLCGRNVLSTLTPIHHVHQTNHLHQGWPRDGWPTSQSVTPKLIVWMWSWPKRTQGYFVEALNLLTITIPTGLLEKPTFRNDDSGTYAIYHRTDWSVVTKVLVENVIRPAGWSRNDENVPNQYPCFGFLGFSTETPSTKELIDRAVNNCTTGLPTDRQGPASCRPDCHLSLSEDYQVYSRRQWSAAEDLSLGRHRKRKGRCHGHGHHLHLRQCVFVAGTHQAATSMITCAEKTPQSRSDDGRRRRRWSSGNIGLR